MRQPDGQRCGGVAGTAWPGQRQWVTTGGCAYGSPNHLGAVLLPARSNEVLQSSDGDRSESHGRRVGTALHLWVS